MSAEPITCNALADYEWLTGDEAAELAAELEAAAEPLHSLVGRLRGRLSASKTHLLLELVELRRRATEKFSHADRMFFTRVGLEQATDEWVARHKATRFTEQRAGSSPTPISLAPTSPAPISPTPISSTAAIADLCCGIGGDLLALGELGAVIGIDQNPLVAHLATANARYVLPRELSAQVTVTVADAENFDVSNFSAWHIDPDRRPAGSRTTSLEWSSPRRDVIERMLHQQPNAAIKLAPGAHIPHEWSERCELEWISRDCECRQLVAWHGALAKSPGHRRATMLASRVGPGPGVSRTVVGQPNQPVAIADRIDRYIFDIDPAVSAARLTGALAADHAFAALARGPSYLTGSLAIDDAALACFKVEDILPLQTRTLAAYLRERSIGRLEIKKRGVEIDPEKLRRELRLRGDESATLLIARHADRHVAVVGKRVPQSS